MEKFYFVCGVALFGFCISLLPLSHEKEDQLLRVLKPVAVPVLWGLLLSSIVWLLLNGYFNFFPVEEIRWMNFDYYVHLQGSFWAPLTAIIFGCVSHFTETKNRRALILLSGLCVVFAVKYHWYYIDPPDVYFSSATASEGKICNQTTQKSCGAASLVNLLSLYDVNSSEGEMAQLAELSPQRGVSYHQAANALSKKFLREGKAYEPVLVLNPLEDERPFMTMVSLKGGLSHMIVVEEIKGDEVFVIDPNNGRNQWSLERFNAVWRGGGVVLIPSEV